MPLAMWIPALLTLLFVILSVFRTRLVGLWYVAALLCGIAAASIIGAYHYGSAGPWWDGWVFYLVGWPAYRVVRHDVIHRDDF